MSNLITYLQLFGIGLGVGLAGPCLLSCFPIMLAYSVGSGVKGTRTAVDITLFLAGRTIAYFALGCLAGFSGMVLRRFLQPGVANYLKPAGGVFCVLLGLLLISGAFKPEACRHRRGGAVAGIASSGMFLFGISIGLAPCGPLLAILFQIALMSGSAFQGGIYALSFGLGTFIAGILTVGIFSVILANAVKRYIASTPGARTVKILSGILLIALGVRFLIV